MGTVLLPAWIKPVSVAPVRSTGEVVPLSYQDSDRLGRKAPWMALGRLMAIILYEFGSFRVKALMVKL
jgi:type IV secretory pathway protease TraF